MTVTEGDPATVPDPPDPPSVEPAEPGDQGDSAAKAGQHRSSTRSIAEWILVIGGALIVALLIRNFVFTTFWIPSESMEPTLIGDASGSGRHDRVIVNRLSYKLHDVRRGDIVVFSTPPNEAPRTADGREIKDLIKRVIGLPGETITISGGRVHVNGKVLPEPYLPKETRTYGIPRAICPDTHTSFVISKGSVLVLGDNRAHSEDGRCFGTIRQSTIVGRAFVRIWPLNKMTWL